jgi:large subunit ribosomal protein L24
MERKFNKQPKLKIKKGDQVVVIAGDDKTKKGRVLEVFPETRRVLVEGVNINKKHLKPRVDAKNPNGGIISMEAPISISNVMLMHDGKATRVGRLRDEDGKLKRFARASENKEIIK